MNPLDPLNPVGPLPTVFHPPADTTPNAFPLTDQTTTEGMNLREVFAAAVLVGLVTKHGPQWGKEPRFDPRLPWAIADAVLKERKTRLGDDVTQDDGKPRSG